MPSNFEYPARSQFLALVELMWRYDKYLINNNIVGIIFSHSADSLSHKQQDKIIQYLHFINMNISFFCILGNGDSGDRISRKEFYFYLRNQLWKCNISNLERRQSVQLGKYILLLLQPCLRCNSLWIFYLLRISTC